MKLVTPPFVINESDGFTNDVLGRKAYGEALLNLVTRSSDELVISLDGQWGEGKTTFIKMWQGLLKQADIPNIYVDAFANDYVDDAFIAVASAITGYVDTHTSKPHEKAVAEFKDKAKKVGSRLLSWTAKQGVKAATLGALSAGDFKELAELKDELAKGVSGVVGDFIEERLTSHAKDIELLTSFKELLSDLPTYLHNGKGKPLVIIIDELDRCKPTFAVEVIEKIKHLFSVENVVFVLVMNKKQLENAIKCVYGEGIDAHAYLQKFINIETTIPNRIDDPELNDITKYCHRLFDLHELKRGGDNEQLLKHIKTVAVHFGLRLRSLERVFTI
jgi:predicted KAP-like P-loop ATPase